MNATSRPDQAFRFQGHVSLATLLSALSLVSLTSQASDVQRPGKQVVEAVCAPCHASGGSHAAKVDMNLVKAAPKIGDTAAWSKRASQGLSSLTAHALQGIRNMPAHGGSPGTSDIEVERAIIYMVNQSGGRWIEPIQTGMPVALRSSENIVHLHCSQCHETGLEGAPRIGDRAAWIPRLKNGMEALVASAIHGHGAMPARGGLPDLKDAEIRSAIAYMFNYGIVVPQPAPPSQAKASDPNHRLVADTDVYLGLMPVERIRMVASKSKALSEMHGGIPRGANYYHVNISLADNKTRTNISDAAVSVKIFNAIGGQTKALELFSENNAISYGNYFQLQPGTAYTVMAQIRRPDMPNVIEAQFDFKAQ